MEAESNHSRPSQPPIMVDYSTGREYVNGQPIPLEVVLFKFRHNHEASLPLNHSGDARCNVDHCFCDQDFLLQNAQVFCESLRKLAECRGMMCPYAVENLLKDKVFNVLFEWYEMGDDWDPKEGENSTNVDSIPNRNPDRETNQGNSSSSSVNHPNERLPQEEVVSNDFSPISSTTSPPAPCAENESTENQNPAQIRSGWAGVRAKQPALEVVRRMDVDEDNSSIEPEISQMQNESRESDENSNMVEPLPETTETSQRVELLSTNNDNDIQKSGENQVNLAPQQAVNEESEPETQNGTSSHQIDDSSSPPECPTISGIDAQAAAVAVPNIPDAITAGDVISANSSSVQSDNNGGRTDKESVSSGPVIEKLAESSSPPKSNPVDFLTRKNVAMTKEQFVSNAPEPTNLPANETDSQPPEYPSRRWEENEGYGKGLPSEQRKSSFDSSGDCARERSWLERIEYTSSVNISDAQDNDEQSPPPPEDGSEELEEGEIDSQEDTQQAEVQKEPEPPVDKTIKGPISTEKRITRSGTNSPVPFQSEEGVRTRSRCSVPGPASVKRDRESRAAKTTAQSKISSLLGAVPETPTNEEVVSSPTRDSTATTGLRKRLRTSDSATSQSNETPIQHQTRSTVNKSSLSRKRAKILPDENENSSDVPSCSSRSSTPTIDEPYHHPETRSRQERRNSSSPSPIATRQSQKVTKILEKPQTKTSNEKKGTDTEEQSITNKDKDSDSSDSDDSSSSDSGESHVSEIPLAERLEKKRKREDKERRRAAKGKNSSVEARSRKSERKRKKKHGPSLDLGQPESSSSLKDKLPFRVPDIPTTAKKAEACKSTTTSILKSQNILQHKPKQVETETQKVVTLNDDEDDDIQMIQEVEGSQKTKSTGARSTARRSNSTEGGTSTPKPKEGIHISFTKDKSKGLTPQRSLSIPGTSPTNVPENTSPGSTRIEFGKPPFGKSPSLPLPLSTPAELNITPTNEVDLEDHSRWENPQTTSPRKTPQISLGLISQPSKPQPTVEKNQSVTIQIQPSPEKRILTISGKEFIAIKKPTNIPSTSKDPIAIPSLINRTPTSPSTQNQKNSSENAKQISPNKNTSNDQDQASRHLRVRKQIFDPKAEAAKPIPKPVPKVTKEIIQQQQVSKNVPGPAPSSSSISKTVTVPSTASCLPQKEGSNLTSQNREPTAPQKTTEKSQQQQQDKQSRSSETSTRKETGESTSSSNVATQQRERSRSPQQVIPKSKHSSRSASFADGEIRLLPNKPSTSSSSISPTSGTGGTWRRGGTQDNRREKEVDFTDDFVDFETPPDDEDDRRRSNSRDRDRDRNRSGASSRSSSSSSGGGNRSYRGSGHQQSYRYQGPPRGGPGGGPPRHYHDGGGRGHPRGPPFSGPRANMIDTVQSHGRYQNSEEYSQDFFPGMPHPNQFPPPPMEMQFNPQFGPPPGMHPMMGGPRPPFFPNQQFPPRWPRFRM